jgi:hypothetical protein
MSVSLVLRLMVALRMKTAFLDRPFTGAGAENAALLTGRCRLRYCGMTLPAFNFDLW